MLVHLVFYQSVSCTHTGIALISIPLSFWDCPGALLLVWQGLQVAGFCRLHVELGWQLCTVQTPEVAIATP